MLLVGLLGMFDRKVALAGELGCVHPSLEVVMRPPEVFVRPLAHGEAGVLVRGQRGE